MPPHIGKIYRIKRSDNPYEGYKLKAFVIALALACSAPSAYSMVVSPSAPYEENTEATLLAGETLSCNDNSNCLYITATTELDRSGFDVNSGNGPAYSVGQGGGGFGHFFRQMPASDLSGYQTLYLADADRTGLMRPQWIYGVVLNTDADEASASTSPISLSNNELLIVGKVSDQRSKLLFDSPSSLGDPEYVAVAAAGSANETSSLDNNRTEVRNVAITLSNGWSGTINGWFTSAISAEGGTVTQTMSGNELLYDNTLITDYKSNMTLLRHGAAVALTAVPASFIGNKFIIQNGSDIEAVKAYAAIAFENNYQEGIKSTHQDNLLRIDSSTLHAYQFKIGEEYGWAAASAGAIDALENRTELINATLQYDSYKNKTSNVRAWVAGATAAVGSAQRNSLSVEQTTFKDGYFVLMGGAVVRNSDNQVRGSESATENVVKIGANTSFEGNYYPGSGQDPNTINMVVMGGLSVGNGVAAANRIETTGLQSTVDLVMAGGRGALLAASGDEAAREASASQNQVAMTSSTMTGRTRLIGGYINGTSSVSSRNNMVAEWFGTSIELAATDTLVASQNTVYVAETVFEATNNELVGGAVWSTGALSVAEENTVYIGPGVTGANNGAAFFARVAGGIANSDDRTVAWRGNSLITESSFTTNSLEGFQNYGFVISEGTGINGFITVTSSAVPLITDGNLINRFSVRPAEGSTLASRIVLISSNMGFVDAVSDAELTDGDYSSLLSDTFDYTEIVTPVRQSVFTGDIKNLKLTIENEGKELVLSGAESGDWTDKATNETEGVAYGLVAEQMMMAASGDLFVDTLMRSESATRNGWFSAAQIRHERNAAPGTLKGNSLNALIGWGTLVSNTELGSYLEFGGADFDVGRGAMSADASNDYIGAALYANHKLGNSGVRLTGYARFGTIRSGEDGTIQNTRLDDHDRHSYWGAHLGVNYTWDLSPTVHSRLYANYFYDGAGSLSLNSDAVTTELGDTSSPLRFSYDTTETHRVKLGWLAVMASSSGWRPYAGIAVEDVIKAEITGHATDEFGSLTVKTDRFEGITGFLNLGWSYKSSDEKFEGVLNAEASEGTRRGIAATISGTWRW